MPAAPLPAGQPGRFRTVATCAEVREEQLVQVNSQLAHWRGAGITAAAVEEAYLNGGPDPAIGGRFRVQIIGGQCAWETWGRL